MRRRGGRLDGYARLDGYLVDGYADLLRSAPDDVTGNACAVRPEDKFETLGDVERGPKARSHRAGSPELASTMLAARRVTRPS
jgi:hypothetical protein